MRVVARGNTREYYWTTAEGFDLLLAHLCGRVRTYEVPGYSHTRMSNHGPPRRQAPTHDALGRPHRWVMTETARAFHQALSKKVFSSSIENLSA